MDIGIPKEVKNKEFRVGLTPEGVQVMVMAGNRVTVQKDAGKEIGFTDADYEKAGANIVSSPKEVYQNEMIIKVKEPQPSEFSLLKEGQILFCYLHLAPDPVQTEALIKQKVVGIAYETITDANHRLPLLVPMSEVAGRISVQAGAAALQMVNGGKGVLLGGVPGVKPGKVVVLGGGVVGTEAMRMALGLGADVTILDRSLPRLRELECRYGPALKTIFSTPVHVEEALKEADLVIGAVLIPGKTAPKLVTKKMLSLLEPGSVIVDVSIDQGGCFETSRPTTHSEPTFIEEGVVHYCVSNMPAACAKTATRGLTNATLPYALFIAEAGYRSALLQDPHLMAGLNVCLGHVTYQAVAQDLGYEFVDPKKIL